VKHPYLPNFIIQELNRNPEFARKLFSEKMPNIDKFRKQIENDVTNGLIKPINAEQLFINILALNVFPFVGAPLIKGFLNIDDKDFLKLMHERKIEVSDFIINAIKI
jgi:hypothetical protein